MPCTGVAFRVVLAVAVFAGSAIAAAAPKTVCTITVNSPDEKEAFRRRLPPGDDEFVELVEKGRPDWLHAACGKAIACDVVMVSGHFNAGDTFYSDDIGKDEHLRIDELERASCSASCPALFARLKEVYLFGCESLNPDASKYASSSGESGRARMRRIFAGVPVIYGFSASAPRGPAAAALIERHFDAGTSLFGSGRPSAALLRAFSASGMTATHGVRPAEDGGERERVCRFFDERVAPVQQLDFIHATLRGDMGVALASFARIDTLLAALLADAQPAQPFLHALAELSADDGTRARYLAAARATRDAPRRLRMIALAQSLGWLSPQQRETELAALVNEILARPTIGFAEVELACAIGEERALSPAAIAPRGAGADAVLACLGDADSRTRTLLALASPDERDVQMAQAYLRHRPVTDAGELRALAQAITHMTQPRAQIRALDAFGRLQIADREILDGLRVSFANAGTLELQRAIAEIFLRSGARAVTQPDLAAVLRRYRIHAPDGRDDVVDALMRRLELVS